MQMLEGYLLYPLMVDLYFHRWDEILAVPVPSPERKLLGAFRQYARAMAFASLGRLNEAETERQRFESLRTAIPAEFKYLGNKSSDFLTLASATLDAQLANGRGEKVKSIDKWRRVVEIESGMQYDEPPPWIYPMRQSLATALLRNGQAKEAESVFREALLKRPRDGRLLFGLWQSLKAQGRDDEAELVQIRFNAAWKDAT
jgi:tetratricopeptide (TPR) repeat protein